MLFVPLAAIALWGTLHSPPPLDRAGPDDDIELATLPPLPRWTQDALPNFDLYYDVTEKKAAFFSYVYSRTVLVNSRILLERHHLRLLQNKQSLTEEDKRWLAAQAERLRVDEDNASDEMFRLLFRRLDTVPPSLVLAQAANESAWGTSRFARQGNNLFGQWCFSPGCGLIPLNRPQGASHEVARFRSPYHSVRAYVQNLNRHPSYTTLRDLRARTHDRGEHPSGVQLAAGLSHYSERGAAYIQEIRSMIRYNNLAWYDQKYRETIMGRDNIEGLLELATAAEHQLQPDFGKTPDTALAD
ncbi:glucosaminidase domain-containing protein [Marinobacter bryozoorum]|jgi:Bax protein|uniref:glucosaminidase domain-containing protein n=1 Tax=Marinobacter bryozoorum TaxID=256324 RepID=UPI0020065EDA|nr:glucosaminidase domain-containing protein [Marinobacter bryozoorum]MCK7545540.1 glucosaminidase domain-containing protein [Marinobacter bryozoorum]